MAVSLLPNWLHVALTFLLLPGEFYSFFLSGFVPFVHVQDEEHLVYFSQLFTFQPDLLHTMF